MRYLRQIAVSIAEKRRDGSVKATGEECCKGPIRDFSPLKIFIFLTDMILHLIRILKITRYKKLRFHFSSPLCVANAKNEISASDLGQKLTFWHFVILGMHPVGPDFL